MKRNVQISIDIEELEKFDSIVGKGNRSPEIEKLVREFNVIKFNRRSSLKCTARATLLKNN